MYAMDIDVVPVATATEDLAEAVGRLLPQLSPAADPPGLDRLRAIVGSERTLLFVARTETGIVGMLTLVWYDVPSGRKAWVEDVAVDAAVRCRGVGRALVEAAEAHAVRIGAGRLSLTSRPLRKAAHALYRKTGFEEAETTVFVRKLDR